MSALSPSDQEAILEAAVDLFDTGRFLAAHELFEELWEATEGEDADFFKGLLQASVALHHLQAGNAEGARRLHGSHRALLARYQPVHLGLEVSRFLEAMRSLFRAAPESSGADARTEGFPRLGPRRDPGDTAAR